MVLTENMTVMEAIVKMAKGNPGATEVLCQYYKIEKEMAHFVEGLSILDMFDIRGWKIWVAYQSVYDKDINKFREGIRNHTFVSKLFTNPEFQEENSYYEKEKNKANVDQNNS